MTHRRVEDLEHAHLSIDQHRLCPICRASVVVSLLKQWRNSPWQRLTRVLNLRRRKRSWRLRQKKMGRE